MGNKVIPTCFGTYAPSSGDHSPNSNIKFKNHSGQSAPALGTISLKYAQIVALALNSFSLVFL